LLQILIALLSIFLFVLGKIGPFFVVLHFILFPQEGIYFYSSFPTFLQNNYTIFVYACHYVHFALYAWNVLFFMLLLFFLYVVPSVPLILKELRPNKANYVTFNHLRTLKYLLPTYRSLEVLHLNVNSIVGLAFIPEQTLVTQLALFSICTMISRWNELDVITTMLLFTWTAGFLVIWSTALEAAGLLHMEGRRLLLSWKHWNWNAHDKKVMSKFRKSCRPIGLRVGSYHIIKRTSVLSFLRGIVRGTFRALLTIHKK